MDGHRIIGVNGVDLCVDTTSDAADPAILLISGMGGSMDWWEEEFSQRLAAGRRFVIRYDHRDTGRSVSYPAGAPGYTGADLAADVVGVLDAFGRRSAHLAGISMGGALAQQVALAHPDHVDSLALMSTSPPVPAPPDQGDGSAHGLEILRNGGRRAGNVTATFPRKRLVKLCTKRAAGRGGENHGPFGGKRNFSIPDGYWRYGPKPGCQPGQSLPVYCGRAWR